MPPTAERAIGTCPDVFDAIGDLPDVDAFEGLLESDELRLTPAQWRAMSECASPYARTCIGLDRVPGDLSQLRASSPLMLTSCRRTTHTAETRARFGRLANGAADPISRLFRLHPHGISRTLRAGSGYDRGSFTAPRPVHPFLPRVISVREAARLHGYPDWFRFHTSKWHGFRQVGNSVPPPLGRAVAHPLLAALGASPDRPASLIVGDPALVRLTNTEAAEKLGLPLFDERRPSNRQRIGRPRNARRA
jgi:DNA (cytosine-5)-methyltransferase 1